MATKRRYRQTKRKQLAGLTRDRIVDAARRLFSRAGVHDVSLDDVAQVAGVGRTTVFEQVGSKLGLVRAVEEDVSRRAGSEELFARLSGLPPSHAMREVLGSGWRIWDAERSMFRALFALARVDRDVEAAMREKEQARRGALAGLLRAVARSGGLQPGWREADALDALFWLTGFESYDALRRRRTPTALTRMFLSLGNTVVSVSPRV